MPHPLLLPSLFSPPLYVTCLFQYYRCHHVLLRPLSSQHLTCYLRVFRKGFEDDRIEALLHKIEIQMKHQSTSFGLALTSVCDLVATATFPFCFDFGFITNNSF